MKRYQVCASSFEIMDKALEKFEDDITIISRCHFEVTIQDDTDSATTIISDKIGKEILSLTAAEIHDIRCVKKESIPLTVVHHKLLGKKLIVQIKKLFAKSQDTSSAKLLIMSMTEKDNANNQSSPVTVTTPPESSKRKL